MMIGICQEILPKATEFFFFRCILCYMHEGDGFHPMI